MAIVDTGTRVCDHARRPWQMVPLSTAISTTYFQPDAGISHSFPLTAAIGTRMIAASTATVVMNSAVPSTARARRAVSR